MRRLPWVGRITAAMMAATIASQVGAQASARPTTMSQEPFAHVYVIMMENEGNAQIVGNPELPYINRLIRQFGYDDRYYGVTHVSLPNYVAAITGNNWYSNSDNPTQIFPHTNLVDQLESHHLTWKAYMQSMPYAGFTGYWYPDHEPKGTSPSVTPPGALYALKHNPFTLMADIRYNPRRLRQVVPFSQLRVDLTKNHVPNFVWISPNLVDDMHGQAPGAGDLVLPQDQSKIFAAADRFVKETIESILRSRSWRTSKSVIFLTWDEAAFPEGTPTKAQLTAFTAAGPDAPVLAPGSMVNGSRWPGGSYGGGRVPLIIVDSADPHHFVLHTWADHYSLLRTIEQNWNLGFLGMASDGEVVHTLPIPGEPSVSQ